MRLLGPVTTAADGRATVNEHTITRLKDREKILQRYREKKVNERERERLKKVAVEQEIEEDKKTKNKSKAGANWWPLDRASVCASPRLQTETTGCC